MKNFTRTAVAVSAIALASPSFAQTAAEPERDAAGVTASESRTPAAEPEVTTIPGMDDGLTVEMDAPEGYAAAEIASITAEELTGSSIMDPNDETVGEISDVEIGPDGSVSSIITDIGGFLGIGEHTVSLSTDQVQIFRGDDDVVAYVTMTKDELEALPEYVAPAE